MKKSFTLIELLVVIAIIGILAAIAMPSISNVRAKARDSKRLADLNTFKTALEMYFSDHGEYPIWTSGCLENTSATSSPFLAGSGFVPNYMRQIPKDPLYGKGHCFYYKTTANGSDYHALAFLEKNIQASKDDGGAFDNYYEVFSRKEKLDEIAVDTSSGGAVETAMGSAPPPPPPSGWTVDGLTYTTRRKLTIDQTKVDADLTDFPVLVKLTSTNFDFSKANSDGFDIRFTSSDGTTLLKYERERHDNVNGLAEYWVKIPSVSGTANTDFYIYYRTTDTADGADPTNVWDANFKMVQHLKDITTSTVNDSTANANNGAKIAANEPIEADGKIAKAQNFDGINDYINISNENNFDFELNTPFSISAWVYHPGALGAATETIFSKIGAGVPGYYLLAGHWSTSLTMIFKLDNSNHDFVTGDILPVDQWVYVTMTYNGTNYLGIKLYLNGVECSYTYYSPGTVTTILNNESPHIGKNDWAPDGEVPYWKGKIDEIRVSNVTRSAAWIKADYNSGNDSLLTYEAEEIK